MNKKEYRSRAPLKSVTYYPLLSCNAQCPFCSTRVYVEDSILSSEDFRAGKLEGDLNGYLQTLDEAKQTYRELFETGVEAINIQGGEPTLFSGLGALIAHGWEIGFQSQTVVTNGIRLKNLDYARRLLDEKPTTIALSIFGATESVHNHSLGVEGAFDALSSAVENLVFLKNEKPDYETSITGQVILHRYNFEELPQIIRYWAGLGIRTFNIRLLTETPNTQRSCLDWFFDLEALREPLATTFDYLLEDQNVSVSLTELPFCLFSPRHLGFVEELAQERRSISHTVAHIDKGNYTPKVRSTSNNPKPNSKRKACDTCDMVDACFNVASMYENHFSGERRAIDLQQELRSELLKPLQSQWEYLGRKRFLEELPVNNALSENEDLLGMRELLGYGTRELDVSQLVLLLGKEQSRDLLRKLPDNGSGAPLFQFWPRADSEDVTTPAASRRNRAKLMPYLEPIASSDWLEVFFVPVAVRTYLRNASFVVIYHEGLERQWVVDAFLDIPHHGLLSNSSPSMNQNT